MTSNEARPDQTREGGCTCRHVRYRMTGKPLFVHACHCTWCQRETGTAFALNAMIEADRVEVEKGDFVCLHTGFAEFLLSFRRNPTPEALHGTGTGLDGKDEKSFARWARKMGDRFDGELGSDFRELAQKSESGMNPVERADVKFTLENRISRAKKSASSGDA
mgnify:CR=1 FL=1